MVWTDLPPYRPQPRALAASLQGLSPQERAADLLLAASALQQMQAHATDAGGVEVLGLLLGEAYADEPAGRTVTVVLAAVPAYGTEASPVSVSAGPGSWIASWDALPPGSQVVGWYHSHPGHGVFFSATDRRTQQRHFPRPWQVGVVVDPSRSAVADLRSAIADSRAVAAFRGAASAQAAIVVVGPEVLNHLQPRDRLRAPLSSPG